MSGDLAAEARPNERPRRFLRPGALLSLDSGLWLVDEFQPVAAVVDPRSGALRDMVSWPALPPAAMRPDWPPPIVTDGTSLWTQQHRTGPLLRVGPGGDQLATWTEYLELAVGGPGEVWCAPSPPRQELLHGANSTPMPGHGGWSELLRVSADGHAQKLRVDRVVRGVHATAEGVVIEVDDDPWELAHRGGDTYEVVRARRYLTFPWGAVLPASLTVTEGSGTAERPDGIRKVPDGSAMTWYESTADPRAVLHAAGHRWRIGRITDPPRPDLSPWFPVLATAHGATDDVAHRYDLGPGSVLAARPIADDTAVGVAVRRPGGTRPVQVLSLRPGSGDVTTLLAPDAIDVTAHCWPLAPRPVEADSYAGQILARCRTPDGGEQGFPFTDDTEDVKVRLRGPWPHTELEWTFRWTQRPGLVLRRRVPLYDELGRLAPPEFAEVHIIERLHTGGIPPASAARDGVLDL